MIVIVRRVRGVPIAPGCGRLLHRNHRSAVRRFARAAAPAIEHHPVQPIAVRAAATRPPRSQVGLDDLWFWEAGFSPDMDASLDTPPRRPVSSLPVQLAEARREIQLERKRKETLLRCLRPSGAKLLRLRYAHQCTLRELGNAKELIAISDEFRAAALSPVQVDEMLNV